MKTERTEIVNHWQGMKTRSYAFEPTMGATLLTIAVIAISITIVLAVECAGIQQALTSVIKGAL